MEGLDSLNKFDYLAITRMNILNQLSIQTWNHLESFSTQFCSLLANLKQLRILKLVVEDTFLNEQLKCINNPKLRYLEISGRNLKVIHPNAFLQFNRNPDLTVNIVNTDVEELPSGLFSSFSRTSHLSIELRNNKLSHLSPEVLYVNYSSWKRVGARSIRGKKNSEKNTINMHFLSICQLLICRLITIYYALK